MTGNALDRIGPPAGTHPRHVGQATAVEQSRAIAEVQAAVVVAQQVPRDVQAARAAMLDSCGIPALAERAFFSYSRGGSRITGPSVHLARELARCWGNFQYGLTELSRNDDERESQMQAWAWDVQTNTRNSSTFIVKHKRDTSNGPKELTDGRDIYENNANNGARRLREAILATLPTWYVEEAKAKARQTQQDGGGVALPVRVDNLRRAFRDLGVTDGQLLERMGGRRPDQWDVQDVTTLGIVWTTIRNGESTVEEEFPVEAVTASEILQQQTRRRAPKTSAAASTPTDLALNEDGRPDEQDAAWLKGETP